MIWQSVPIQKPTGRTPGVGGRPVGFCVGVRGGLDFDRGLPAPRPGGLGCGSSGVDDPREAGARRSLGDQLASVRNRLGSVATKIVNARGVPNEFSPVPFRFSHELQRFQISNRFHFVKEFVEVATFTEWSSVEVAKFLTRTQLFTILITIVDSYFRRPADGDDCRSSPGPGSATAVA